MMSGGLHILMHGIDFQWHLEPIRPPSETDQSDSLPNTLQNYLFQKVKQPCHTQLGAVSQTYLQGEMAHQLPQPDLCFFLASPDKIAP